MSQKEFTIGASFSRGWAAFVDRPGLLIGAVLLITLINLVGMIPFIGVAYQLIVAPILAAGYMIIVMNVMNRRDTSVGDIFAGFSNFGIWLGVHWLWVAISLIAIIPGAILMSIGIGVGVAAEEDALAVVGGVFGGLVMMVGIVVLSLIWGLAYWVVADDWNDGGVIAAFKKSAAITKGHRLTLFLGVVLICLIGLAGVLALVVGVFVAVPIGACMYAGMFKELREIYEPPIPQAAGAGAGPEQPVITGPPAQDDDSPIQLS